VAELGSAVTKIRPGEIIWGTWGHTRSRKAKKPSNCWPKGLAKPCRLSCHKSLPRRGIASDPGSGIRQTPLVLPIILLMTQYRLSSRGGSRFDSGAGMIAAGGHEEVHGDAA
jgi:hypothetical protein